MADALAVVHAPMDQRRRTADRVFRGCLFYTSALTLFWLFLVVSGRPPGALFSRYEVDLEALRNVFFGFLFFSVLWGLIWYGIKNLLLRAPGGLHEGGAALAFSSRMHEPFALRPCSPGTPSAASASRT